KERKRVKAEGTGEYLHSLWSHSTHPFRKSHPPESNRRPTDYESVALPTELGWRRLKASLGSRSPLGGQVAASTPPLRPGLKIHPSRGDDLVEPLARPIAL